MLLPFFSPFLFSQHKAEQLITLNIQMPFYLNILKKIICSLPRDCHVAKPHCTQVLVGTPFAPRNDISFFDFLCSVTVWNRVSLITFYTKPCVKCWFSKINWDLTHNFCRLRIVRMVDTNSQKQPALPLQPCALSPQSAMLFYQTPIHLSTLFTKLF